MATLTGKKPLGKLGARKKCYNENALRWLDKLATQGKLGAVAVEILCFVFCKKQGRLNRKKVLRCYHLGS